MVYIVYLYKMVYIVQLYKIVYIVYNNHHVKKFIGMWTWSFAWSNIDKPDVSLRLFDHVHTNLILYPGELFNITGF